MKEKASESACEATVISNSASQTINGAHPFSQAPSYLLPHVARFVKTQEGAMAVIARRVLRVYSNLPEKKATRMFIYIVQAIVHERWSRFELWV